MKLNLQQAQLSTSLCVRVWKKQQKFQQLFIQIIILYLFLVNKEKTLSGNTIEDNPNTRRTAQQVTSNKLNLDIALFERVFSKN